jgi:sugar/nucleoside kinase (ribokinase family)
MSFKKISISGTGCALADYLYKDISFNAPSFRRYLSEKTGDGGLNPGKLVFTEELEKFSGKSYSLILGDITGNRPPDGFNVGGPSLVSLIHVSQMLDPDLFDVDFFGMAGRDATSERIFGILQSIPLGVENYIRNENRNTPFTDVFSDPEYDGGHGERTFVNNIGAAWDYSPVNLGNKFFGSDIVCFGGTALVPQIHDNLTDLLARARNNNCITIVNTVFDFRNEKSNPGARWPLVKTITDYELIDILIMDCEESLKISGKGNIEDAARYFESSGISSFIITNGANDLYAFSSGGFFKKQEVKTFPVSEKVKSYLHNSAVKKGDTTGCGDNFAGGIISSAAWQIREREKGKLDLVEAVSWGVASGGFTCFIDGGAYVEKSAGEKLAKVSELKGAYINQIGE